MGGVCFLVAAAGASSPAALSAPGVTVDDACMLAIMCMLWCAVTPMRQLEWVTGAMALCMGGAMALRVHPGAAALRWGGAGAVLCTCCAVNMWRAVCGTQVVMRAQCVAASGIAVMGGVACIGSDPHALRGCFSLYRTLVALTLASLHLGFKMHN
jgi:hypothetical protein